MVDITNATSGIGAKVGAGVNTGIVYITIALICIGIIGLILWLRYVKSFNHQVVIKRPMGDDGSFEFDMGYKGRYVFKEIDGKDQQMVFQIFRAQANKINYTEGAVPRQHRIACMVKGKRHYLIIFEPDKDGFLHPTRITSKEKGMLESQISQASLGFAAKAVDNITQKYRKQDFMQKYGLLIFIILILIIAALYWWGSKSNSEAIKSIADGVAAQSQTQEHLSRLIEGLINGTIKAAPQQTVTVIS